MSETPLVIIGKGTVGKALLAQLAKNGKTQGLRTSFIAGKDTYISRANGFDSDTLRSITATGFDGQNSISYANSSELIAAIKTLGGTPIVVDVTAAPGSLHAGWRREGWHIVTANKKPLSDTIELFDSLVMRNGPAYRHEATVAAGLPVIRTIETLHATGDCVRKFSGMLSGTMGAIFSSCDQGMSFSEAVIKAKNEGFTEPDPRDDLSGMDIARKALILARLMGQRIEIQDLRIESLVPTPLLTGSIDAFLKGLSEASKDIEARVSHARMKGHALRYLAEGDGEKVKIGLVEVAPSHPAFGLSGPENLIVLHSERYKDIPLTIRGPGAGAEVTAAGVMGDIIHISERVWGPQKNVLPFSVQPAP